ncbi:hypothetical protein B9Z19DRAFT_1135507 [Tuber borchii]|uniref:Uncharacterized protein n=1 Tax=Tuber borchii TaxID=42251 RepID=A0A2T6ZCQ4_TUBBO|nr:hypothetical protein B9Z19DRAFT_1135507 [Tuber borchii]
MDSTPDSERPPAPLLDHITTDPHEDSYTDSGDPTKLKNAKNIGTTTPEVEGEDNEPVTTIEDYPSTPVSTMDPLFQSLPLTGESREDSTPLPPTPEEPEFRVSEEAETTSLSPPTETEEKQSDGVEEPKAEVREGSDMGSKPAEGEEVVEVDEKVEVPESSETKQEPSEVKAVDLETGEKGLETLVEKMEEGSAPEAANLKILEPNASEEEPSKGAPGANGEIATAIDETPAVLNASDFSTEALRTAEPVEGTDDKSRDTPAAEVAEDVTEKLSSDIIDTKYRDNSEPQNIQDSEPAIDEPKAEEAAYGGEGDSEVQQEHEAKEAEHPEVTEPAMGNTDPNTKTAEHTPDAILEAVVEKREDGEVRPKAGETDTTIGDHESEPVSEAVPVLEADSVPSLEKSSVAEGPGMAQSETIDLEAGDALEPIASPETKEAEETRPEVTGAADAEPEEEKLLLEKSTEVAEEPKDEVEDEPKEGLEALKEESEEEPKGETTEATEAEPPTMEVLPLAEPPKEEVSISSAAGQDSPDSESAKELAGDAKEESETNELVEPEPQAAQVLPVTEPSKEGDDSPSVEADPGAEPESTGESKEDMKVETEHEVEEEPESGATEISEPVKADPAVPDALLTETPEEEVPSIGVEASPQSEPSEEPEDRSEVFKAEPLEGLDGETGNSTSEELRAPEEVGAPASMGAPLDDGSGQELEGAVAAEPDIPKDKEQETQEVVQVTSILDKAKPEESEHKPADAENSPAADVKEVAPVEIYEGNDASTVSKTEIGGGISADAGPEAPIGESEEATKSEPITGLEPKEVFTETLVEEGKLSELAEVPTVVVEKTIENQPSYGEDLGPDATEGQKEAFEMRKADAEPDEVIMTEESPTPQIVPVEENTFESTPDDSGEAPSEPMDEIKAEPATNPAANEKGEDLAQDEPIVVSHDDAPPGEVEKAEAAVEYPRPDPQEAAEAPKEAEAAEDGKPPVSPEQKHDDELEGEPSSVEELVAVAAVVTGETTVSGTDDNKDLPGETSTGPVPASGSFSDPASTTGGNKAQVQTEPEATDEVTEAAAGSSPLDEPQSFETPSDIVAEHVLAPRTEEPGVMAPTETSDKAEEPTSSKELEEASVARGIAHSVEPTREASEENVVDSSVGPGIKLDQDSCEGVVTSSPTTLEGTQQVVKEEASVQEPEEKEQEFSVSPLPASQTIGNPIDLAPGEKVPVEFKVSTEDTVQAEDNPSEHASAKPSEIPLPVTGDVKPTVQPEAPAESRPEEQIFSINPLPDSKTFGNPINLRPGEPIPICLTEASVADNVKLDEEMFKKPEDKAPVAEEAKAEGSDGGTGEKILAVGVGAGLAGLGAYAAVRHFDDKTEASKHSSEKASPVASKYMDQALPKYFFNELAPASPTDPEIGGRSPAIDASAKPIPSAAQEQVLPIEVSFTTPAIPKELSESPVVSKTEIEPAHPADGSTEEIKPAGTEVLDKAPLQASAIDIPDDSAVSQSAGKSGSDEGDEVILEPAPQSAQSPVHGLVAPEEHVLKALKDAEASETPAIVVSAPPNPATGSGTAEVIQPSSSEVAFDEVSANKARESGEIFAHPVWNQSVSPLLQYSLENTPEGVRKRRAPGAGGEVSRPTSSGADTVSTRHHRNIMNGFWHVVLFGWLRGFGRFFGGIFSKSKSKKQRK